MNPDSRPDAGREQRIASRLLDVLVRAGFVAVLALLCNRVFAPFLTLMAWAVILAVALYPVHQSVARRIADRQGLAATLIVVLGTALIVVPSALLMRSLGDSVRQLIDEVQTNSLEIAAPSDAVAAWPVVGPKLHALWSQAHADLPALVQSLQPQVGELVKSVLGFVASIGGGLLQFLAALVGAGIIMAFGQGGDRTARAIFERVTGEARGAELAPLSTATIRAVAVGPDVVAGGDVLLRHHQQVHRRLGVDVLEGEGVRVLVDDAGRDLLAHDLAEQAVAHGNRAGGGLPQNSRPESRSIVTGPSFTSSTSMWARKTPVSTGRPRSRSSSQKRW